MNCSFTIDRVGHVTSGEVKPFGVQYNVTCVCEVGGESVLSIDYGKWTVSLTTGFHIRVVRPWDLPKLTTPNTVKVGDIITSLERRFLDDLTLEAQWMVGHHLNRSEQLTRATDGFEFEGKTTTLKPVHTDDYDRHMTHEDRS